MEIEDLEVIVSISIIIISLLEKIEDALSLRSSSKLLKCMMKEGNIRVV